MKKILPIILLAALIALGVRFYLLKGQFFYAGTLESTKVDISVQVPSTISKIHVREGDHVQQGAPLLDLACEDLKNAARFANENYERYTKLAQSGSASPETLDTMRTRKEDADIKLSWCSVKAPLSGTLVSRYREPGEWVSPGMKVLTLSNTKDIWAYIYIPQPMLSKVSLGMKVKGFLPDQKMRLFEGKIIKINEEAEFTPKNVQTREERSRLVFGIKISFLESNTEGVLKPGMTLEVDL